MAGTAVRLRWYGALAGGLLLVACSGGGEPGEVKTPVRSPAAGATDSGPDPDDRPDTEDGRGTRPGPSATGLGFTPDPARTPGTRAEALRLARAIAGSPGLWGPGYVPRTPFESAVASWPVLDGNCVWQLQPVPSDVLASVTRSSELPAEGGKGPVRVSAVVTVHRDAEAADWEMAGMLEEALRCPDQRLRSGERISGLISTGNTYGDLSNYDAEDRLAESGEYYSDELGGPHYYFWSQARLGQVTVAVVGKGSKGRTRDEIDGGLTQGISEMLLRTTDELQAPELQAPR
ncbi:hypothetical protein KQY30_29105 [Streptomyces sp. GMY02]|uniref:hypothetical protein n=1 Tax=Streptomyces sp. GMY02 TaxID=1333528 RepID=UPI001C2BFEEC|nr:hypothetical protein [Streptomyces sp. GMY02]QXE37682.1 hypothetical protein KQY30_29105 [Streptomyces sp. GMY02]